MAGRGFRFIRKQPVAQLRLVDETHDPTTTPSTRAARETRRVLANIGSQIDLFVRV